LQLTIDFALSTPVASQWGKATMQSQMLAPSAVLVLWSIVMLFWTAASRLPVIQQKGGIGKMAVGARGQDFEGVIPDKINWKSHNYTHLMEQPTLFYAVSMILAITGAASFDVILAWGYVMVRIVHSLWQSLVNRLPIRFALFALSSSFLLVLAVRAATITLAR
jgi:hypothetical protein